MSRAWMPLYIGDYLRDTGHLTTEQHGAYLLLLMHCWQYGKVPSTSSERAAIAKMSVRKWKGSGSVIDRFFRQDGTQKRVEKELGKVEKITMQRHIAGAKGGLNSSISRAARGGISAKQMLASRSSKNGANGQRKTEQLATQPPEEREDGARAREATHVPIHILDQEAEKQRQEERKKLGLK